MPTIKERITKPCVSCGKPVSRLPCQLKGPRMFCSKACVGLAKRNGSDLTCDLCGTVFYRRFGEQDREVRIKSFCSEECRLRFRALNRKANVYPKIGSVHIHRLVAERILGRKLLKDEVVHHIDENRHNHRPDNLAVFPSQSKHTKCHQGKMSKEEFRRYCLVPDAIL